jgi:hypothetical protein
MLLPVLARLCPLRQRFFTTQRNHMCKLPSLGSLTATPNTRAAYLTQGLLYETRSHFSEREQPQEEQKRLKIGWYL